MKEIDIWLDKFINSWKTHDIDGVMELFEDDVEYWETPFIKLKNVEVLRGEWEGVKNQHNIILDCRVFSQEDNKYSVIWDLEYDNPKNEHKHYKGVYLLRLNQANKCEYFFHCGESAI